MAEAADREPARRTLWRGSGGQHCRELCAAAIMWCTLLAGGHAPAAEPVDRRHIGSLDMSPALQAMQADDAQNPAQLWVASGRELWRSECARCHGEVEASMRGVAARYPMHDAGLGRVVNLNQRVRACRSRVSSVGQGDSAEAEPVLALQALLALQSRGLPVQAATDPTTLRLASQGEALFNRRLGALDLSCAHCHEQRAGLRLGGSVIPQGHPTGYPVYRIEWQTLGSLSRRLRACVAGVRATPFAPDSQESLALEAYLARRAAGLTMDAPGVRP